jgi:hypothetical protein
MSPRTKSGLLSLVMISSAAIAGCSGGDPKTVGGTGDPGGGGAPPPSGDQCKVPTTFGDLGSLSAGTTITLPQAAAQPTGPKVLLFNVSITDPKAPTAPADILHLELWEGTGFFASGFKPGTYQITGAETDYYNCSACVIFAADFDQTAKAPAKFYMAKSGTVTLTAVDDTPSTGKLTGSLSNIQFTDVDVSGMAQVAVNDGCATSLSNLGFNLSVQAPPAM